MAFLTSCTGSLNKIDSLNISINLPLNYVQMSASQFITFFSNSNYPDSVTYDRLDKVKQLESLPNYAYFQDTTNIYNSILIMGPPYINLNKKTHKLMEKEFVKSIRNSFPENKVECVESSLKYGTYNYGKFKYKISSYEEDFLITYYTLNKNNESKMIVINNQNKLDFEEIIRTIE